MSPTASYATCYPSEIVGRAVQRRYSDLGSSKFPFGFSHANQRLISVLAATATEKQSHCQLLATPPRVPGWAIYQSATLPLCAQETLQLRFKMNFRARRS